MASKAFSFVTIFAALVSVYAVPQAFSGEQSPFPSMSTVCVEYRGEE